ncbi:MAG: isoprenylcysteine carboxylmethyltransferase family protein [Bacteroidota bacterium]
MPAYLLKKRTGIQPIVINSEHKQYNFIGHVFKIVSGLIAVNIIVLFFFEKHLYYLIPFLQLDNTGWHFPLGAMLVAGSLIWIVFSQQQMANSWRIGIDTKNKTELVSNGVFSISRNPIYLGLIFCFTGIFFLMPNLLVLIVTILGIICIFIQVKMEESFLEKTFGQQYLKYKKKVRRWI